MVTKTDGASRGFWRVCTHVHCARRTAVVGYTGAMEQIILQILDLLRAGKPVDDRTLVRLVHAEARREGVDKRSLAKRRLLPFYQRIKRENPDLWESWNVTPELERDLLQTLRMKPRRTASGVATITVITKPWPCSGDCLFCPNDLRMPKSYLHAEPACARAEQNCFDPYLQVSARLTALSQMGHATDKIELIVLGGTWSDYPEGYQVWFISELFRALNDDARAGVMANPMLANGVSTRGEAVQFLDKDSDAAWPPAVRERRRMYRELHIAATSEEHAQRVASYQELIDAADGATRGAYNRCVRALYQNSPAWAEASCYQNTDYAELERQQHLNETAEHRVVGLVIETRPDAITLEALTTIRRLGATKIQMGIQSLDQHILDANERHITVEQIERAFTLVRLFGFKIHAHMMLNLLGATPAADKLDYEACVHGQAFRPDEIKLYPCALIEGTRLCAHFHDGSWRPYTEDELLDVLATDIVATPAFCRISRMIRDFSSDDIMVGNKKPNLRQLVENRLHERGGGASVREIRYREIGTAGADLSQLSLEEIPYKTSATHEYFLQWVTPEGKIAGFLRLSLPNQDYVREHADELPITCGEAMIREVHVYGMVAHVGKAGDAAQHHGLGRALVERACELAREAGYERINVISAVGTRAYYRGLGFATHGLYQQKEL